MKKYIVIFLALLINVYATPLVRGTIPEKSEGLIITFEKKGLYITDSGNKIRSGDEMFKKCKEFVNQGYAPRFVISVSKEKSENLYLFMKMSDQLIKNNIAHSIVIIFSDQMGT